MGSSTSKFRKALQRGEGVEAMQIYLKNPDIKRNLDPNYSYGENHGHNTALHYASMHGIRAFVREFLAEKANPNIRNGFGQNSLHCICFTDRGTELPVDKSRAECLSSLLEWTSSAQDGAAIELDARDKAGNTPLHYAANSGLLQCVKLLVANGASLYEENSNGETACDCAIKQQFNDIASFLESRMVFSGSSSANADIDEPVFIKEEDQKQYRGLCAQDLQEAKDLMLVETADMLRVPLFTAEGLLRNHDWSKEALIEAWMTDAAAACEKAGVTLPESHLTGDSDLGEKTKVSSTMQSCYRSSEVCSICDEEIVCEDVPLSLSCGHEFCRSCWESYLNVKIREGKAHSIQCPAFNCSALVPVETIESLVSREMARRYVQFDIKAFVESNPTLKWCPAPGCGRAVRLPSHMLPPLHVVQAGPSEETAPIVVDCGGGHFFCWHCSQEAHAPCTCELWSKWSKKIAEMMSKIPTVNDISECPETETVANTLWLVTNSKSCPNCKSPIQKNEGCNHMKCTKCKHEFCWVCLEQWKKHSSATGGYFRCNRFEVVQKIDAESVKAVNEANTKSMHITEINCFLHYYSRFKNHETSYKFEEPLLSTAKDKMMALALAAMETAATSPENADTSFIEGAVHELLKARRVLRASYAYGYYLTGNSDKKAIFESMQTEVEEATETLSQMVARPYLRTPRERIIQTTQLLHRKRQDFLLALSRGLIPEDDQPSIMPRVHLLSQLTNSRDSESDEDEDNYDEVCHTIEQSIRERLARLTLQEASLHPGAHSGDNPDEQASGRERPCAFLHKKFNLTSCDLCNREKARDRREERKKRRRRQEPPQPPPEAEEEIDVDFMRAVQLSLLQHSTPAKRDSRQSSSSSSPGSTNSREGPVPIYSVADSTSLQRAIELSLQDSSVAEPSSTPPDDDLKRAIKLSLQDSGLPPESHDGSGNTDSPAPSQGSREPLDSDSNSEFDFCI